MNQIYFNLLSFKKLGQCDWLLPQLRDYSLNELYNIYYQKLSLDVRWHPAGKSITTNL